MWSREHSARVSVNVDADADAASCLASCQPLSLHDILEMLNLYSKFALT